MSSDLTQPNLLVALTDTRLVVVITEKKLLAMAANALIDVAGVRNLSSHR